jgi:hypothetical protein
MLQPIHLADERPIPYATAIDFSRTFTEELHSLYLLSLLLTADHDKAEECFVSAMGDCGDGLAARCHHCPRAGAHACGTHRCCLRTSRRVHAGPDEQFRI